MHAAEFPLLSVGQFGLLTAQFPLGAGDGHALAGAHADEIGFELGEGGEDIEEQLSRVVEGPSEGQFHASFPKLIGDGARIWDGPCQPVEFRHDQRFAFAHGGEGLVEAGASAGRAGEAVIGVDAILGDAKPSITTTGCRIRWLTVLVQLRISGCGKIATALCQVQFTHKNHLAS